MQRSKKHIIGAIGLASVAAMTVAAYNIPAPSAFAETSGNVPLRVNVHANNTDAEITGDIKDGTKTAKSEVTIPVVFSHAEKVYYRLTATQGDDIGAAPTRRITASSGALNRVSAAGSRTVIITDPEWIETDACSQPGAEDVGDGCNGELDLDLNLKKMVEDAGFDLYRLTDFELSVKSEGRYGGTSVGDSIHFYYGQITIDTDDNIDPNAPDDETNVPTDSNGDPVIAIQTSSLAARIHTVVTNEAGEVVLEGDYTPDASGVTKVTLAFAEKGLPSGYYTITASAYDETGTLAGQSSLTFRYIRPEAPGLPNTGGLFAGLNITRGDFLASGLIVFGLAAVLGLALVKRHGRTHR